MAGEIPVYGPGTTNRIIPWFTVTNPPYNYALPQYLGNRLSWGTWGGENQPVLFPAGHSNLEYALAQDYNNPNHIRQWNPMLFGFNLDNGTTDSLAVAQGNIHAFNWGASMMNQQIASQKIAAIAQSLGSLEAKLTSVLKSNQLTDAQRATIQSLLEKVQAKKAEIQNKLQQGNLSNEELEAIQGEIIAIQEEISEAVGEIIKEIESNNNSGNTNEGTQGSQGSQGSENNSNNRTITSEEAAKKYEEKYKKDLSAAIDICRTIYSGSIGNAWSTDYDTIRKGTAKINKDNAAMVVLAWDKQLTPTCKKSLVKALFDEEHFWNPSLQNRDSKNKVNNSTAKNIDMIWNITSALEEKAKELGIYEELAGNFITAYDELDDTCVDEEAIEKSIQEIAEKVYEKQVEKEVSDIQQGIDKTAKSDETKTAQKQEKEAKALFLQDIREILKDDKLEVSEKVQYKNGKFTIRIEGKNYEGKDYVELAKNIQKAGYDPKEYLVKQPLNKAA